MALPSLSSSSGRKRTRNIISNTASTATTPKKATTTPVVPLLPASPEFEFGSRATTNARGVAAGTASATYLNSTGPRRQAREAPPTSSLGHRHNPFMSHVPIHSPIGGYSLTRPSNLEFFNILRQDDVNGGNDNNSTLTSQQSAQPHHKSDYTPSPSDRALKRALLLQHTNTGTGSSSYSSVMAIPILEDVDIAGVESSQQQGQQLRQSTLLSSETAANKMVVPPAPPLSLLPSRTTKLTPAVSYTDLTVKTSSFSFVSSWNTTTTMTRSASVDALSPPAPLSKLRRREKRVELDNDTFQIGYQKLL
jgi:hypothetical protein